MPWVIQPELPISNAWYVETGDDFSTRWYLTSDFAIVTGPEWYVSIVSPDDSEPWRSWIDTGLPNTTFLRKSEAPEDFMVNPEDVATTPENTQADHEDWRILPDPD